MPKLHLISLGCTKNLVDSEVMLGALSHYERVNDAQDADIIIINTCGFIASAKKESIDKILEVALIKKDGAILIVSGCLSERYADELQSEIPEIDIITGVGDYDKIESMIQRVVDSHKNKQNLCDSTESRPLRGARNRIQGCSSATADFLLEAEKRGSPPKSEKRQLLARRGSGAGGAALLRKEKSESSKRNGESSAKSALDSANLTKNPTNRKSTKK